MAFLQSYIDLAIKLKGIVLSVHGYFPDSELQLFVKLGHAKDEENHIKFQVIMFFSPRLS